MKRTYPIHLILVLALIFPLGISIQAQSSDIVAYYRFNESTGTTANDLSGNDQHGTLDAGASFANDAERGWALRIEGSNEQVQVAFDSNDALAQLTSDFTLSMWVKETGNTYYGHLLALSDDGDSRDWLFQSDNFGIDQAYVWSDVDAAWRKPMSWQIPDNAWIQITFSYASGTLYAYLNGSLQTSYLISGSPSLANISAGIWYLGGWIAGNSSFNGWMSELSFWKTGLTAGEAGALYAISQVNTAALSDYTTIQMESIFQAYEQSSTASIQSTVGTINWTRFDGVAGTAGTVTYDSQTDIYTMWLTANSGMIQSTCQNPSDGGHIAKGRTLNGVEYHPTLCAGETPDPIVEVTAPAGTYNGTLEYQWEQSIISSFMGFTDIAGATQSSYAPPALNYTTWYRRKVKVSCESNWLTSNSVVLTVVAPPDVQIVNGSGTTAIENIAANYKSGGSSIDDTRWKMILFTTAAQTSFVSEVSIMLNSADETYPSVASFQLFIQNLADNSIYESNYQSILLTSEKEWVTIPLRQVMELNPSTTYALIVSGLSSEAFKWANVDAAVQPPTMYEGFTYQGSFISTDAGQTWSTASGENAVEMEIFYSLPTSYAYAGEAFSIPETIVKNGSISWSHNGLGSLTGSSGTTPTYTPAVADLGQTIELTATVSSNYCASTATAQASIVVYELNYRTKSSGNWTDVSTWERTNGISWEDASVYPNAAQNNQPPVHTQLNHPISLSTSGIELPYLRIESSGKLTLAPGTNIQVENSIQLNTNGQAAILIE